METAGRFLKIVCHLNTFCMAQQHFEVTHQFSKDRKWNGFQKPPISSLHFYVSYI